MHSVIGMPKVKIEPTFGFDFTEMLPFNCCKINFEIVRPRPIPPRLMSLVFAREPKNLNSFWRSSSEIPMPESWTSTVSFSSSNDTCTVIYPSNVNLEAFPTKLNKICLNLFISDIICSGTSLSILMKISRPFILSWYFIISHTSSIAFLTSKNSLKT